MEQRLPVLQVEQEPPLVVRLQPEAPPLLLGLVRPEPLAREQQVRRVQAQPGLLVPLERELPLEQQALLEVTGLVQGLLEQTF